MRPISTNNDLLRHEQQQRLPILQQFSKTNDTCCKVQRLTVAYMRSKQRKMRYNYNPKTRLQNNNRYAKAVVYTIEYKDISSLNYTQFIQTLKREVEFKDKCSSIYYYTKTADNTVATKLYRATFVIKLLI
ncbi:hypothetical protein HBI76_026180 [Parastagonospora nodorum]|nr:hypothetical protein HBI76_026180 [Parastagonospora nodorum]